MAETARRRRRCTPQAWSEGSRRRSFDPRDNNRIRGCGIRASLGDTLNRMATRGVPEWMRRIWSKGRYPYSRMSVGLSEEDYRDLPRDLHGLNRSQYKP